MQHLIENRRKTIENEWAARGRVKNVEMLLAREVLSPKAFLRS